MKKIALLSLLVAASMPASAQSLTYVLLRAAMEPCRGLSGVRIAISDNGTTVCAFLGTGLRYDRPTNTLVPTNSAVSFVDSEIPTGTIDGVNATFTLSDTPTPPASLMLFRNGVKQRLGLDFVLSGATITYVPGAIPQPSDIHDASFRRP